jgi:hypothetical protein
MIGAVDALARLREGNRRFVESRSISGSSIDNARRADLVAGQDPFAVALGYSDSRVPAEVVFDQGFGELFVWKHHCTCPRWNHLRRHVASLARQKRLPVLKMDHGRVPGLSTRH